MKNLFTLVVVVALCSSMGFAQGLGFKGIGGSVGYTSVSFASESLGGFVVSAHADMGELATNISLVPELQYWSVSKEIVPGVEYKLSDFAVNANAHYNIAMEGSVKPYVGAGLGLNFYSITQPGFTFLGTSIGSTSVSETRLGINLMGGANIGMGSFTLVPEVRYVVSSDVNHFIVKVGVTFPLGK